MDLLQRQVDELQALQAMFPEPAEVVMDAEQLDRLSRAESLLSGSQGQIPSAWTGQHRWNGSICPQGCTLDGGPVALTFHLPACYPDQQPELQVECSGNRKDLQLLTDAVQAAVREADGTECLALCVTAMADQAALLQQGAAEAREQQDAADAKDRQPHRTCLMRRLIWFHHIKSVTKRKHIVAWAAELSLGGFSKPGFPGIIICEGEADDVEDYTARLRSLKWSAMAVRADETDEVEACDEEAPAASRADQHPPGQRRFRPEFHELSENGMSELSAACDSAGLRQLFLAAMKL